MKKIDLHLHSNLSDGDLSSLEVIKLAEQRGCCLISITDHDNVMELPFSKISTHLSVLSGVELNATIPGMHILGYGMSEIQKLKSKLYQLNLENEGVCLEVIRLLQRDGYDISKDKIKQYYETLSLPCDILDKKKIVKYLIHKNYTKSVLETYNTLIGREQKYYVPIEKMTPKDCIEQIHHSGGVAVLAHPATLYQGMDPLYVQVKELTSYGLDGIEVMNQKIPASNTNYYKKLANEFHLIETVGSDFHSLRKQVIGIDVEEEMIEKLEEKINYTRKLIRS